MRPNWRPDALGQGMVLYHVENVKLLNSNHLILFGVLVWPSYTGNPGVDERS